MPDLGLPDPADYNPPTNWTDRDAGDLVHPSGQTPPAGTVEESETSDQTSPPSSGSALTAGQQLVSPFPPAPPTVSGEELTRDINLK